MARFAIFGWVLLTAFPCAAITIAINDPNTVPLTIGTSVFQTQYRMANSAFDLSITPTGGTPVTAEMGTVNTLSGQGWAFTLTNTPGSSLVLTMSPVSPNTLPSQTLTWSYGAQNLNYTALRISLHAGQGQALGALTNLFFTSPGILYTPGSAFDPTMTVTNNSTAVPIPGYPVDGKGSDSQWLLANMNLHSVQWTLSGQVVLTRTSGQGAVDGLRFTVDGLPITANFPEGAVPEPSSYLLMAAAAGALYWRRRRARLQA